MIIIPTDIDGPVIIEPKVFRDERGHFIETFQLERYIPFGIGPFVQDNWSRSKRGVLRGLHFQRSPRAQGKLVMVTRGAVWDVAVDIRRSSRTFGKHVAVELTEANARQFWVPPGFAHGFIALTDDTDFLYKCTDSFVPEAEGCIHWSDPGLALPWPIASPLVSPRDEKAPLLRNVSMLFA